MSNELLPFGTGSGANVLGQASYSGLAARQTGFQAGTALSAHLNKVWRQSSVVASMIGEFISGNGGGNVVDDGDVAALKTKFETALRKCLDASLIHLALTDTGTANAIVATATPAISAYAAPCFVIFRKKASTPNTGSCTADFGGGAVALKDNRGNDLPSGALAGGSINVAMYDGTSFLLLSASSFFSGPGPNVGQTVVAIVAVADKFNPGDAGMALGTVYSGANISGGVSFPPGYNSKLYAFGGPNAAVVGLGAGDYSQPEMGVYAASTLSGSWKLVQWAALTTGPDAVSPYFQHTNYHLTFQRIA